MPNSKLDIIDHALRAMQDEPRNFLYGLSAARAILSLLEVQTEPQELFLQDGKTRLHASWFEKHPVLTSERAAVNLRVKPEENLEAKLYWIAKSKSLRQKMVGAVHFTANYEDNELTRHRKLPVGIDFFLNNDATALTIALSHSGNVRVLTLEGKLTNTARTILNKWTAIAGLTDHERRHSALWDSVQLSEVNKAFYKEIAEFFKEIVQSVEKTEVFSKDDAKQYANKLLGRLLFVWFLRKKGVIAEQYDYFTPIADSNAYYRDTLSKLFFYTLNTPIEERNNTDIKTPYLNGGLFEETELDRVDGISLPDHLFTRIYNFFDGYNFTTDESTPDFEQVAIDPEMLGRIFENLLAEQNTETGEQARKASGAFYTPREVVDYMCRESLRQYLYTKLEGNIQDAKTVINKLIDTPEQVWAIDEGNNSRHLFEKRTEDRDTVRRALQEVKVLDPACGSGAFPMGIMQLLLRTFTRIDRTVDEYKTKLAILQDSIYGVDINPMAADIARLRAWLSLVVDETNEELQNNPLPNLDFKFITANSLIPLEEGDTLDIFGDNNLDAKLSEIRNKFFRAKKKSNKNIIKSEYLNMTSQVGFSHSKRSKQLQTFNPFNSSVVADFFDSSYMLGVTDGFDIVIGNPPYVSVWNIDKKYKSQYEKTYVTAKGHYDIYVLFYEMAISNLHDKGVLSFITSNKWMAQSYGKELRKLFLKNTMLYLVDFSAHQVFESATVDTQISIIKKHPSSDDYNLNVYSHSGDKKPILNALPYVEINTSIFAIDEELNFKISLKDESIKLIQKIKNKSLLFSHVAYISKGAELHSTLLKIKKEEYIFEEYKEGRKKYVEGKFFKRFQLKKIKYLKYTPDKHKAPVFPELFEAKKIIVKNVVGRAGIQAIIDNDHLYNNDALINVVPYHELADLPYRQVKSSINAQLIANSHLFSLEFMLGILNSSLSSWYFEQLYANGLHFYPRHMKNMILPTPESLDSDLVKEIENTVRKISQPMLDKHAYAEYNELLDSLVNQIYNLTDDESKLIRGKPREDSETST